MKYPTPGLPLIATNAMCLGMAGCYDSYAILVAFKYPLIGVSMTSRWPALISPSPNIMIGVIEMIVMMMMEVKTSKHIVDTDRQLSSELLLILTWHSLFFMMELLSIYVLYQILNIRKYIIINIVTSIIIISYLRSSIQHFNFIIL